MPYLPKGRGPKPADIDRHRTSDAMALNAINAKESLDARSDAQLLELVKPMFPRHLWHAEVVEHDGVKCMKVLERRTVTGFDGITPFPVAVIQLERTPWRTDHKARKCVFVLSFWNDQPFISGV